MPPPRSSSPLPPSRESRIDEIPRPHRE
jgi:hypothetical protein